MQQEDVTMNDAESIPVVGKDGLRGTLAKAPQLLDKHTTEVLLRLENGQEIVVPLWALTLQSDGSYYLALGPADMAPGNLKNELHESVVLPVIVEELDVQKRQKETAKVRITTVVHERQEVVDQPLMQEEIDIQHFPINRLVESAPQVRHEDDVMIVPILEEVLVVEKRLMLKEELHISRRRVEVHKPQHITLRSEEAIIERIPLETSIPTNGTISA
jgi:uncharacterized protein (TIGR02271 family)